MNEVVHTSPTIGSNVEEIVVNNTHFLMWDIGGQESLRSSWNTYYTNTEVSKLSQFSSVVTTYLEHVLEITICETFAIKCYFNRDVRLSMLLNKRFIGGIEVLPLASHKTRYT